MQLELNVASTSRTRSERSITERGVCDDSGVASCGGGGGGPGGRILEDIQNKVAGVQAAVGVVDGAVECTWYLDAWKRAGINC